MVSNSFNSFGSSSLLLYCITLSIISFFFLIIYIINAAAVETTATLDKAIPTIAPVLKPSFSSFSFIFSVSDALDFSLSVIDSDFSFGMTKSSNLVGVPKIYEFSLKVFLKYLGIS